MRKHRFSTELEYYHYFLNDARSIVMTSFFSHKTVSHLDLEITQPAFYYRRRLPQRFRRSRFLLQKSFFSTEESLKNNVVPKRRLLYTLNLDFPDGREYSNLRNGLPAHDLPDSFDSLFVVVKGQDGFFSSDLVWLIKSACDQTDCILKLLKWMVGFRPLKSVFIPLPVQISCAKNLYLECVDPEFAIKFWEKSLHLRAFLYPGESKVLEYFLYNARLRDFDVRNLKPCRSDLTNFCFEHLSFGQVHSFLKYEDTVYYTDNSYEVYKRSIFENYRLNLGEEEMNKPENKMSKRRLCRMLQIIYIFQYHEQSMSFTDLFRRPDASEALRLVWSSIPDSLVSLQEMNDAFGDVFLTEIINRAHGFYEESIQQTVSCREPRPLSHYCRTIVRKSLHDSKKWLPDGIKQLKLPPRFESFLNLQDTFLLPSKVTKPSN